MYSGRSSIWKYLPAIENRICGNVASTKSRGLHYQSCMTKEMFDRSGKDWWDFFILCKGWRKCDHVDRTSSVLSVKLAGLGVSRSWVLCCYNQQCAVQVTREKAIRVQQWTEYIWLRVTNSCIKPVIGHLLVPTNKLAGLQPDALYLR